MFILWLGNSRIQVFFDYLQNKEHVIRNGKGRLMERNIGMEYWNATSQTKWVDNARYRFQANCNFSGFGDKFAIENSMSCNSMKNFTLLLRTRSTSNGRENRIDGVIARTSNIKKRENNSCPDPLSARDAFFTCDVLLLKRTNIHICTPNSIPVIHISKSTFWTNQISYQQKW